MSVKVYVACKMSGRDKVEMIQRANLVKAIFAQYNIEAVSPVIEEGVKNEKGPLVQASDDQLKKFWKRDKDIIAYETHVVLLDEAFRKSLGMEREHGFSRYCLWKPVVTLLADSAYTVASIEDDYVVKDLHEAGRLIRDNWGTWGRRAKWRIKMLAHTLPKFIYRQIMAWR